MELRIPYGHPGPQDVSHGLAVILYEMTGPALQPAWGIGSLTRPWIPHGIHHGSQDIERDPDIRAGSNAGA